MDSVVPPKIQEILKKAVKGNFNSFVVSSFASNKKGEGYLGEIFFISLRDKTNGKQSNFVVKQAFSKQNIRDSHPIRLVFLNEISFYTKIWPTLEEFQRRVPQEHHFHHLARCFATSSETNFERLVLENLKNQGFEVHDKKKTLEKHHFEFIFRVYGKFHAMSFAYRELCADKFMELEKEVTDAWVPYSETGHFQNAIKLVHQDCLESLQPGVDDAVIEKYKHYVGDGVDLFRKNLVNDKSTTISLTHGDCWTNNIMFKYDNSGKLIDIRLLDFQLLRLGPPVCDLSYCLYSGGTKEIFDDLNHLLQIYHDSLSESLRAYGCDPDRVYSLETIKSNWKRYCQMGMTLGLMLWRGRLTYEHEVVDFTDMTDSNDASTFFQTKYDKETYKKITRDIILHLYENDYLF